MPRHFLKELSLVDCLHVPRSANAKCIDLWGTSAGLPSALLHNCIIIRYGVRYAGTQGFADSSFKYVWVPLIGPFISNELWSTLFIVILLSLIRVNKYCVLYYDKLLTARYKFPSHLISLRLLLTSLTSCIPVTIHLVRSHSCLSTLPIIALPPNPRSLSVFHVSNSINCHMFFRSAELKSYYSV